MHQRSYPSVFCHRNLWAFSLVELSIVLVILGLLVGGVLSGQSLIHAAELRSVTTEHDKYFTAVNTFRDKYFALAGDMTNATQFWGVAGGSGSDATCYNTVSTSAATCNGDGNGNIGVSALTPLQGESLRFWQHLANAGLIEGSYNGSLALGSTTGNSAASKLRQGLWLSTYYGKVNTVESEDLFDGDYGNVLLLGASNPGSWPENPIINAEDMWNIDTKLDDGKANQGKVVVRTLGNYIIPQITTAADGDAVAAANYKFDVTDVCCQIIFRNQY